MANPFCGRISKHALVESRSFKIIIPSSSVSQRIKLFVEKILADDLFKVNRSRFLHK